VAEMTIKALNNVSKVIKGSKVLIMGLTYKENVADTRETPAKELIKERREYGVEVYGCDPLLDNIEQEFGINYYDYRLLTNDSRLSANDSRLLTVDCIILTVAHDSFKIITLDELKSVMNESPILIDVRGIFDRKEIEENEFYYRTI